jgi:hypothetical protein
MAIKANFTRGDVEKRFNAFLEEIEKQQVRRLQMLGEKCVAHAKSISPEQGFHDQTGNLRSSIGYMVFKDGVAIHGQYEVITGTSPAGKSLDGSTGAKVGEALARKVGEKTKGISLVVTAGMNYALAVESKGRDVISSAEHLAQRELPKMLEKLIGNIQEATTG